MSNLIILSKTSAIVSNIIVSLILLGLLALAITYIVIKKRKGHRCIGCSDCKPEKKEKTCSCCNDKKEEK